MISYIAMGVAAHALKEDSFRSIIKQENIQYYYDTTQFTYTDLSLLRLMSTLSDYIIPQITIYILPCTHMYGMTHQKALKTGIIVATLLVTVSLVTQQQPVYSSSGAFDQGYQDGRDARLNDGSSQAYCDPNNNAQNPDAYCAFVQERLFRWMGMLQAYCMVANKTIIMMTTDN